ncbi:MAG: hypothetical protein WKF96_23745 [Solirubrobacteraceae bacterium]
MADQLVDAANYTPPGGLAGVGRMYLFGVAGVAGVAGVTATVTPRRDRRAPYTYTVSGRVRRPAGIGASGCRGGRVSVQWKAGTRTISTRRVTLRADCSNRARVTFRITRRLGRGRLTVQVRFLGSDRFKPASARRLSARAG